MAKKVLSIIIITILQILVFTTIVRAKTVEITTETLNMRKEPSTESDIVALMSVGDECEVLSDEGDWYKVKYGEYTGYISKEYTKTVGEEDNGDEEEKEPQNEVSENTVSQNTIDEENEEDTTSEEQTNTVTSETNDQNEQDSVVILKADTDGRITPLINGRIIEKLKKGTEVTIINELNSWVYIQTDTTSCWIRKDEVTTKTSNNSNKSNSKKEDDKTEAEKKDDNKETELEKKTMYAKEEYVNIRKEPSTDSELVMTVERNTEIDVIGETGDWYKVETSQGEAYISKELLTDKKVTVTNRGNVDRTKEEKEAEATKTSTSNSSNLGKDIVSYAKKFLGVPYVYGGASSSGFDCSGFTMYVFDHFGISMRHGAQAQSKLGKKISVDKSSKSSMINNLKAGDLVFFLDYETMDEIGHCGIYIGDGNFIHASSGSGYCVKINSLLPGEYYNTRYCAARRVL